MSPVLRYLAVVCLAVTLTGWLAGSDELARSDWLGNTGCSASAVTPAAAPDGTLRNGAKSSATTGKSLNKKTAPDSGEYPSRCLDLVVHDRRAALENT